MLSNRVDSESLHPFDHFDTKIEIITMKKIALDFFNAVSPKCAPVGGEPPKQEI